MKKKGTHIDSYDNSPLETVEYLIIYTEVLLILLNILDLTVGSGKIS